MHGAYPEHYLLILELCEITLPIVDMEDLPKQVAISEVLRFIVNMLVKQLHNQYKRTYGTFVVACCLPCLEKRRGNLA